MPHVPTTTEWVLAAEAALLIAVLCGYLLVRPSLGRLTNGARVASLAFATLGAGLVLAVVVLLASGIRASSVDLAAESIEEANYPAGVLAGELIGFDPETSQDVAAYAAALLMPLAALCGVMAFAVMHSAPRSALRTAATCVAGFVFLVGLLAVMGDTGPLPAGVGWFALNLAALAALALASDRPAA